MDSTLFCGHGRFNWEGSGYHQNWPWYLSWPDHRFSGRENTFISLLVAFRWQLLALIPSDQKGCNPWEQIILWLKLSLKDRATNPCEMFAMRQEKDAVHVSFSVVTNASIVNCLTLPDTWHLGPITADVQSWHPGGDLMEQQCLRP